MVGVGGATFPVLRERWSSVMLQEAELHFSFRFLPVSVQLARLKSLCFLFCFYKSVVLRSAFQLLVLQFFFRQIILLT